MPGSGKKQDMKSKPLLVIREYELSLVKKKFSSSLLKSLGEFRGKEERWQQRPEP
jgi:hypothetical protein